MPTKACIVKAMVFYSSHEWIWELDCEESWALRNWCFWTVVLEKTLVSPLDFKEIQPVHPKGYQTWVFIGRTDVEAETPVLWPPAVKSWLIGKDLDTGKDWGQEKGMAEDEMVGWHHRLNGHGFGWTMGVGDGQGGLACCCSWGHKESDTTERLNWTELKVSYRASLMAQMVKNLPALRVTQVQSWVWKIPWRRAERSTPLFLPEELQGQKSLQATAHGVAKSWTWLND